MKNKKIYVLLTLCIMLVTFIFTTLIPFASDNPNYGRDVQIGTIGGYSTVKLFSQEFDGLSHSVTYNSGSLPYTSDGHALVSLSVFRGSDSTTNERFINGWYHMTIVYAFHSNNKGGSSFFHLGTPSITNEAQGVNAYIEHIGYNDIPGSSTSYTTEQITIQYFVFFDNVDISRGVKLFDFDFEVGFDMGLGNSTYALTVGTYRMDVDNTTIGADVVNGGMAKIIASSIDNSNDIDSILSLLTALRDKNIDLTPIVNRLTNVGNLLDLMYQFVADIYLSVDDLESTLESIEFDTTILRERSLSSLQTMQLLLLSMSGDTNPQGVGQRTYDRWVSIIQDAIEPLLDLFEDIDADVVELNNKLDALNGQLRSIESNENYYYTMLRDTDSQIALPDMPVAVMSGVNFVSTTVESYFNTANVAIVFVVLLLLIVGIVRCFLH